MSRFIVHLPPRHRIRHEQRDEFITTLCKILHGRVKEAYIFGSFFTNRFAAQSDLDLIIIAENDRPFVERGRDFLDVLSLGIPVDLLVYTTNEWAALCKENEPGFWRSVRQDLRRIV